MNAMKKMLTVCRVPGDCEQLAHDCALLAKAIRADLYVLAIVYNPFGVKGLSFPRPSLEGDYRELIVKTTQTLQEIVDLARQHGVRAYSLLLEKEPLDAIHEAVSEKNIDLLVLPAYSQTRLESVLSGRTNRKLLREMPCSILYLKNEPKAVEEEYEEEAQEGEEMAA